MTKEQKLEQVYLSARAILSIGDRLPFESETNIIDAWLRIPTPHLGNRAPIELLDEDFDTVVNYLDEMYAKAVIEFTPVLELRHS